MRKDNINNWVDAVWRRVDKEIRCEVVVLNENAISTKIDASTNVDVSEKLTVNELAFETWEKHCFENAVMLLLAMLTRSRKSKESFETKLLSTSCWLLSMMMKDKRFDLNFLENFNDKVWMKSETIFEFFTYDRWEKSNRDDFWCVANSNFSNLVDDDDKILVNDRDSCRRFTRETAISWKFVDSWKISMMMSVDRETESVSSVNSERAVLMKEIDVFVLSSFTDSRLISMTAFRALYLRMSTRLAVFFFFSVWYLTRRLIVTLMQQQVSLKIRDRNKRRIDKELSVLFADRRFIEEKEQQISEKNRKQIKKMINRENEIRLMFREKLQKRILTCD